MPRKTAEFKLGEESGGSQTSAEPSTVTGLASSAQDASGTSTQDAPVTKGETVVIRLDQSGRIDLGSMREKTRKRLQSALEATPELLSTGSSAPLIPQLPDAAIDAVYQIIGAIESWAAARKFPADICDRVFTYQKQELDLLREPTQTVIQKYMTVKHKEEIALLLVLTQIHFGKIRALNYLVRQKASGAENVQTATAGAENVQTATAPQTTYRFER